MKSLISKRGFTLIELVLYIAIIAGFLATTIFFALRVVETGQRSKAQIEIQQNLRISMERLSREIRSAVDLDIANSTFNTNPGVLTLEGGVGEDPIVFEVNGGILQLSRGAAGPFDLTTDDVTVTDFTIKNHSVNNRTKILQIELTMQYTNQADSVYYNVSSTARTSAVIRTQTD